MKKVELKIGDKSIEATLVDFETLREEHNSYKLSDGSTIRMKTVVANVIRTEEFTPPASLSTLSIHRTWLSRMYLSNSKSPVGFSSACGDQECPADSTVCGDASPIINHVVTRLRAFRQVGQPRVIAQWDLRFTLPAPAVS
jgi:hypothetical protein